MMGFSILLLPPVEHSVVVVKLISNLLKEATIEHCDSPEGPYLLARTLQKCFADCILGMTEDGSEKEKKLHALLQKQISEIDQFMIEESGLFVDASKN